MPRTLLCFAAVAVFALPCRAEQTARHPETLIRLNVSPAPAPKPALRYRLLPELKEMNPGNPIQNYMKCMHGAAEILLRQGGVRAPREAAGHAAQGAARAGAAGIRPVRAEPGRPGRPARQSRLADPAEAEGRRVRPAAPRRAADPRAGQGPAGAVPGRGRPGPLRRRDPNRQDDVRHVAPPGRAPDVHRQPGGHRDRVHGHRPPGRDARAAGLPQPLLGADEPAQPLDPPGQGHGRRAGDDRGGCSATWTTAPR